MLSLIDIEVLSYQCLNGRFDKIIVNDLECENIEATPSYQSSRLVVSFNLVDTCSISLIPGFHFHSTLLQLFSIDIRPDTITINWHCDWSSIVNVGPHRDLGDSIGAITSSSSVAIQRS